MENVNNRKVLSLHLKFANIVEGVPKKVIFKILLEPRYTRSITSSLRPSHPDLNELVSANYFFGRFLLSRIKPSKVMSIEQFGPAASNFG